MRTKPPHQEWEPGEMERPWVLIDTVGPIQEPNSLEIPCHIIKILQVKNHWKRGFCPNSNGAFQFLVRNMH